MVGAWGAHGGEDRKTGKEVPGREDGPEEMVECVSSGHGTGNYLSFAEVS